MSATHHTRGTVMDRLTRPDDLGTPEARAAWLAAIQAAGRDLTEAARAGTLEAADIEYVNQLRDWATEVRDLNTAASAEGDQGAALAALESITADDTTDDDEGGETPPAPAPAPALDAGTDVVALAERVLTAFNEAANRAPAPAAPDDNGGGGGAPSVADLAGGADTPEAEPDRLPAMVAAADIGGGFTSGQAIEDRRTLGDAVRARLAGYGLSRRGSGPVLTGSKELPVRSLSGIEVSRAGSNLIMTGRTQVMHTPNRHGAASIYREVTGTPFGGDAEANWGIANEAAGEWQARLAAGRRAAIAGTVERDALIAAWCAWSDPVRTLCDQSSTDGMLPAPERTIDRGGVIVAAGGGYDFGTIYDAIGDNTATDAELVAGVTKTCIEVPCLDGVDERLNADWLCITASLLQRRAWPESIEAFISMALAAKLQKTNSRFIAAIVAASTAVDPVTCTGADAFTALFQVIGLAVADMSYRAYMGMPTEFEVVLPAWVREQVRLAVMNRRAIDDPVKADGWMQQQFAKLGVTVHWVYGWQDAHIDTVTPGLPGAATPITALPTEASMLIYPAGTWVKGVAPVVDLDTIYDSTQLASNSYTALFVEDGWLALQVCPYSRVYTVPVDPCLCGPCDSAITSP